MPRLLFLLWITGLLLYSNATFAQREFTMVEGDSLVTMKRYVFMLLETGANRNQDSVSSAEIQRGHMEHIAKLSASGKLVMAGPFEAADRYRGLFVFDVETVEEAEALVQTDPAVSSGRLTPKTFYWWTARGSRLP